MLSYSEVVKRAEETKKLISEIIIEDQVEELGAQKTELLEKMRSNYVVMCQSVELGLTGTIRSVSGLSGGDAAKLDLHQKKGLSIVGEQINQAAARAIGVAEVNAGMGKIVAAPTAGSCGVLPGVILTVQENLNKSEEQAIKALFTAAGLGVVIAERASVSGAAGGCQAEIGSAAGMAAAAAVELAEGTPEMTAHAAALALKSMLGLVCDPVAGLVEIPCIKRNGMGAVIAMSAAEMALAGIKSGIPIDEVIDAMASIGRTMPCSLKETSEGGLAVTPTGLVIRDQFLS